MPFCSSCGNEVTSDMQFCSKCGKQMNVEHTSIRDNSFSPAKKSSNMWYLLPIFFSIIGGICAYYAIKDDDKPKAKNCLKLGIILFVISFGIIMIGDLTVALFGGFGGQH